MIEELGFALLLAVSGASVAWFFPARRYMIILIREAARELEEALRPTDSTYTLLGLYVGFRAVYRVPGLSEVRVLLTLIPRHALLYLPVVYARGEHDTLVIEAEPPGGVLGEECSMVRRATRPVKRALKRLGLYRVECRTDSKRRLLESILSSCNKCLAAWSSRHGVGVALRPEPGSIGAAAKTVVEAARRL